MKIVVFSGSGISAESGIPTFRDNGGLWDTYKVEQVATPMGYYSDREFVLNFYNEMRRKRLDYKPNKGHIDLANLEKIHSVQIITQNIDDLHERAGSTNVLHLHGEIMKARSEKDPTCIVDLTDSNPDIHVGDLAPDGSQLRPHVVWFGEDVPGIDRAGDIVFTADVLIIVGTSLVVYPAASLVEYLRPETRVFVVDPQAGEGVNLYIPNEVNYIKMKASEGISEAIRQINRGIV